MDSNAQCSEHIRVDLFFAVGVLARITGFMVFDAYAHDDARRMFRFAPHCAEEPGDWHLRALVLSCMARQTIWCGDPDAGLTFIESAMVRVDRLTATERAMLHTGRAQALAKLARVQEAAAAVGVADEEFSHARPANDDPVYVRYYDATRHAGETGCAASIIRSRRGADLMRELRRFGEPHKRLAEVAELTHRIGSAVVVS